MSLETYRQGPALPKVELSVVESERTGLRVGRLSCSETTDWRAFDPLEAIKASGLDFVVMRYPAHRVEIAERLQDPSVRSWVADTLLYVSVDADAVRKPTGSTQLGPADFRTPGMRSLVRGTFTGYQNHYSASSAFADISVPDAYADWAIRQLQDGLVGGYVLHDGAERFIGFAVLDESSATENDLTLVGIHPEHRGRGNYTQLLRHLAALTRTQGKTHLITSTQVSNLRSLRGLFSEGFLPVLALNTLHVVRV